MSKLLIKIYYNAKVFDKVKIFEFSNYNDLKKKLLKKAEEKKEKIGNKFILTFEGFQLAGIESIWDENTFKYFIDRIRQNPPENPKLNLIKVQKYPDDWKPPEYLRILNEALDSEWEATKKEIKNELTEKYLNDGKRFFIQQKKDIENESNIKEEMIKELHIDIICNNCLTSNFSGVRYICSECNNFNICEYCYEKANFSHKPNHFFIKVNYPVSVDIQKYNSILSPNRMLLKQTHEPFEVNIDIINNGEESLQGCFLSPIRFGKNYLGCLKTTITDKCNEGDKVSIKPLIKFEDANNVDPLDEYEGYLRLMTEEGIPFGDIIYIHVTIEK